MCPEITGIKFKADMKRKIHLIRLRKEMQASSCSLQVKELQYIQPLVGFSGLLVFLQVGMAGLHPKSEWHLGSKIPTLLVPEVHLPHAATQLDFLLVLETGEQTSVNSPLLGLSSAKQIIEPMQ
jgi:hypothetical protein